MTARAALESGDTDIARLALDRIIGELTAPSIPEPVSMASTCARFDKPRKTAWEHLLEDDEAGA